MSNPAETFLQEAAEILETLESDLLELEADPTRSDLVDSVFRALHTLKGSGEMFGFSPLARFVHHFENAYDLVRSGGAEVTQELISLSLSSRDHISALLDAGTDEDAAAALTGSDVQADLLARIEAFLSGGEASEQKPAEHAPEADAEPLEAAGNQERDIEIWFKPEESAIRNGMRPDLVIEELSALGSCSAKLVVADVPPLEEMDATACYLGWHITLTTDVEKERIEDIFLFFDDGDIRITDHPPVTSISAAEPSEVEGAESSAAKEARPAATKRATPERDEGASNAAKSESIRVQSYRLDELMDQLGELVIAQARLNRISDQLGDATLASAIEEIERLVTGMRDATLSIRMLPIGGVFGKFRRVVRDLSAELGKTVTLETEGGETELDKNVIDRLTEPLVHIIRNSVDHGIESAESRAAAGKPEEAEVRMVARQTGGEVLISVADDGGGLKTDKIREKAIERGLIEPDAEIPDDQVHQLIFAPGFSTAESVTKVSGRGVGMDAVRTFIEDLRGAVDVKSETGVGTTVTLRMPLTLAIIDGLLVRVAGGNYVLPLASVEECVELSPDETQRESGRAILTIRGELVPFLTVAEVFQFDQQERDVVRVVIANIEGRRVGLVVDDVIGQHQTVIKSLSAFHRGIDGLAGCTILGDGSVALILDPTALVKSVLTITREAA